MGTGDCASEREICPQTGKPHRALSLGPGIGWGLPRLPGGWTAEFMTQLDGVLVGLHGAAGQTQFSKAEVTAIRRGTQRRGSKKFKGRRQRNDLVEKLPSMRWGPRSRVGYIRALRVLYPVWRSARARTGGFALRLGSGWAAVQRMMMKDSLAGRTRSIAGASETISRVKGGLYIDQTLVPF